jgi:hypothetical protein
MGEPQHQSVAVILNVGGAALDLSALGDVPEGRVIRAELAQGDRASCVAATLEHECPPGELAAALRRWAARRGWSVTVAPLERRR